MIQLLMLLGLLAPKAPTTAQVQPCVWPNKCEQSAPVLAQIQTCQWPNKCEAGGLATL
jgi:hypothetical protein